MRRELHTDIPLSSTSRISFVDLQYLQRQDLSAPTCDTQDVGGGPADWLRGQLGQWRRVLCVKWLQLPWFVGSPNWPVSKSTSPCRISFPPEGPTRTLALAPGAKKIEEWKTVSGCHVGHPKDSLSWECLPGPLNSGPRQSNQSHRYKRPNKAPSFRRQPGRGCRFRRAQRRLDGAAASWRWTLSWQNNLPRRRCWDRVYVGWPSDDSQSRHISKRQGADDAAGLNGTGSPIQSLDSFRKSLAPSAAASQHAICLT